MCDGECGVFQEGGLRRVTDDDRIPREIWGRRGIFVAERDHELNVESRTGFGDDLKDVLKAILQCAERGVDERATVHFVPWEIGVLSAGGFAPWTCVMKVRG